MTGFEDDGPRYEQMGKEELAAVSMLARQLTGLMYERDTVEEKLKELKEHIRRVSEESLPTAMLEIGLEALTLDDGSKIAITTDYHTQIPAAREGDAFRWLRDNGYGSLIKNEVKAMFGKGEDDLAAALVSFANENSIDIKSKQAVHPQTLKAFVKEKAEAGAPVPEDIFGVYIKRVAKFTNRS